MAITTVLDFWNDQKAKADAALASAHADLTLSQKALSTEREKLATANGLLADLVKQTAQIRADLADAATPADVDALTPKLAKAIRDTRAQQSQLVAAEAAIDAAQIALELVTARVAAATSRAAEAAAAVKAADQEDKARAALRANLTKPPLKTMVIDATAALAAKPWTDAVARIGADIPAELRDCAGERAKVPTAAVENDKKKAHETLTLRAAAIADVENRRQAFEAADAAFRDYVVHARSRFDQSLAVAARVADPNQNRLTDAENASIHHKKPDGSTDAALQTKRNDAAAARKAVATAQIDVDARQADLDLARLKAKAANIDLADPDTDPAVAAAKAALDGAKATLVSAKAALTADKKTDLAAWETAVPDANWRQLADFAGAKRLLNGLKADPGPLVNDMENAEAALVASLIAAEKAGRTLAFLEREVITVTSQTRFDAGSLSRRELGALRGDS